MVCASQIDDLLYFYLGLHLLVGAFIGQLGVFFILLVVQYGAQLFQPIIIISFGVVVFKVEVEQSLVVSGQFVFV